MKEMSEADDQQMLKDLFELVEGHGGIEHTKNNKFKIYLS